MGIYEQFIADKAHINLPKEIIANTQLSHYAKNGKFTGFKDFKVIEVTKVNYFDRVNPNVITGPAVLKISGSLYEDIPNHSRVCRTITSDVMANFEIVLDSHGNPWQLFFSNVLLFETDVF